MPLYEYECDACSQRFELIQKFSDAPMETCPSCGGPVHKMQSAPAFQFKGTGWYVTDYARKDSTMAARSDTSSAEAKSRADRTEKPATADKTGAAGSSQTDGAASASSSAPGASPKSVPAKNS